jgi:hypothetical protein
MSLFSKKTRTGQLRCLPKNAPAQLVLSADSITLKLDNQKYGWKGMCVHQETNGKTINCLIRALGRRVVHLCQHKAVKSSFFSTFYHKGKKYDVIGEDISKGLKMGAGILIELFNTHLLQCGGANALALLGFSDTHIQNGMLAGSHVQGVYQGAAHLLLGGNDYEDEMQFQVCQCTWQRLLQCYKRMCPFGVRMGLSFFCLRYNGIPPCVFLFTNPPQHNAQH